MADVTRALLLPELGPPADDLLKSLALYWDTIVIPDYLEGKTIRDFKALSETYAALEEAEVVSAVERNSKLLFDFDPHSPIRDMPEDTKQFIAATLSEIAATDAPWSPKEFEGHGIEGAVFTKMLSASSRVYFQRLHDAYDLAGAGHLAPVAASVLPHVASMAEVDADHIVHGPQRSPATLDREPKPLAREAAMVSAVVTAFRVGPDASVKKILRFREKHAAQRGRLRAALSDLAEGLQADAPPTTLLSAAGDRYANRVIPALARLEDALKESRISFVLRSLVGATTLAVGTISPTYAVQNGAQLVGQTISYRFSRKTLVNEHPLGYLHTVSEQFATPKSPLPERLRMAFERPTQVFIGTVSKNAREFFDAVWGLPEPPTPGHLPPSLI
jgi:hypothetical protein